MDYITHYFFEEENQIKVQTSLYRLDSEKLEINIGLEKMKSSKSIQNEKAWKQLIFLARNLNYNINYQ